MKSKIFVLGILLTLISPLVVQGALFQTGENIGVEPQNTVRDDLYISGESILIAGPVTGDVFAGGRAIVISAPIGADVTAGGNSVSITSNVADDVRAGGGTVIIQGSVGGDVFAGGMQVSIVGRVQGDVVAGGKSVRLESSVAGDARLGGEEVYINAPIAGSVRVNAERLTLGPNAVLSGDLSYQSPKEMTIEEGATVIGKVTYEPRKGHEDVSSGAKKVFTLWLIGKILATFILALVLGLVFKRFAITVVETGVSAPWRELGRGLVTVIVLPVVSAICFATLIGIPFGVLGVLSFIALLVVGCGFAPVLMGSLAHKWIKKGAYIVSWKTILLGVLIYSLLPFVPVVGDIINALFVLASIGTVAALKWRTLKEWR